MKVKTSYPTEKDLTGFHNYSCLKSVMCFLKILD